MLVNRGMGGGLNAPGFWLELADAGAGAVNTTPSLANGSPTPTFTRATSAWTKLSSGLWASVATGIARSSYIGLTTAVGAYGGYLAEGARTQLVTPTASIRDMTDASWVKVTMTTAKTATGIDGVINSATTITAAGANSTILQTLVAAATSRTYSCWVKRRTGTGTVLLLQGTATLDITALINSSTYTLVQLNDNELNVAYGLQINTSTDALDVDFNQFEAGAFASSPIDAVGTRNADVLTYASAGNAQIAFGTVYCEYASRASSTSGADRQGIVDISGGDTNDFAALRNDTAALLYSVNSGGAAQAGEVGGALAVSALAKIAGSWNTNVARAATNGVLSAGDTSVTVPTAFTTIQIGLLTATTQQMYGTVKNVRIWKTQLSDGQLVSITS